MKFLNFESNGKIYNMWVQKEGAKLWIHYEGSTWVWNLETKPVLQEQDEEELKRSLFSPMTGRVLKVSIKKNDKVKKGQTLLVLSAMKMEYVFRAEADGKIKKLNCQEGSTVEANQLLVEIDYV